MKKVKIIVLIIIAIFFIYTLIDWIGVNMYLNKKYEDENLGVRYTPFHSIFDREYVGYDEDREGLEFDIEKDRYVDGGIYDFYILENERYRTEKVLENYSSAEVSGNGGDSDGVVEHINIKFNKPYENIPNDIVKIINELTYTLTNTRNIEFEIDYTNVNVYNNINIYSYTIGSVLPLEQDIAESIDPFMSLSRKNLKDGETLKDYAVARSNNYRISDDTFYVELNIIDGKCQDDGTLAMIGETHLLFKKDDEVVFDRNISEDFSIDMTYYFRFDIPLKMYDDEYYYALIGLASKEYDEIYYKLYKVDIENKKFDIAYTFPKQVSIRGIYRGELGEQEGSYYVSVENTETKYYDKIEVLFNDGKVKLGEVIED